jgi:vitellogenic carboxypeptidase-like protein
VGYQFNYKNSLFFNETGFRQYYNFLITSNPESYSNHVAFLNKNNGTRKALHVGSQPFIESSLKVMLSLKNDNLQSAKPSVEALLNSKLYKILIYNGQLDLIVPPPSVNNFLRVLSWEGAEAFQRSKKMIWRVNGEVAGYSKTFGPLTHLLIRNAGHIVPHDQPVWALEMITEFARKEISDVSFYLGFPFGFLTCKRLVIY